MYDQRNPDFGHDARVESATLTASRVRAHPATLVLRLAALAVLVGACTRDDGDARAAERGSRGRPGSSVLRAVPYKSVSLTSTGTIVGTVSIDGDIPGDSVVATTVDQDFCGPAFPDSSLVHTDRALGNVVVWLADVKEGKPFPVERRSEIVNTQCRLDPRVQAVVAGTTVNVRNDDRLAHATRFSRVGAGDSLALVPLTNDGQVVPDEHIARDAGLVAVTCARHGWTRGWIAVFPSPYFAVTDDRGTFRLDSVPSGKYTLIAWHERGRTQVERTVEVSQGEVRVSVEMAVK